MNTQTILTVKQIDDELRKLMNEQPKFRYVEGTGPKGCFYTHGPSNDIHKCDGCIFGQAFQRLGISKELIDYDLRNEYITYTTADWLPRKKPDYWEYIQTAQDDGAAWGSLLKYLPVE